MSIVFKWNLAVADSTTWAAYGDSVDNNNPDFFPIWIDPYTLVTAVMKFRLPMETEAQISSTKCISETVFLGTCMWHYKCLR
jgi:hypothetical protein